MTAPPQRPIAGIAARLLAAGALGLMFALVKLAGARGVHIVESVFYRQLFALPVVVGWLAIGPGLASVRTQRIGVHATRAMVGLSAMALNFLAMTMLPLAEATTIGFAMPLFATILAAVLLREATGPWRWGAVAVGFVGVLIVIRPDVALLHSQGALVALAGAALTGLVTIIIRRLGATEPPTTTVFWFTLFSIPPLALLMTGFARMHDPATWAIIFAMATAGGIAQILLTTALRLAPVAVVLPMDYSGLLWATLWGYWLFDALPASGTLLGAAIIIASGLVILWREHRAMRMSRALAEEVAP